MQKFICCLFLFIFTLTAFSQQNYPVPSVKKDLLFYIQHNRGTNTFIYALNYDKQNTINAKNPIKISRQLFEEGGTIKGLTSIQKKFAYGVTSDKLENQRFEFKIVSLPEQKFYLDLHHVKKPKVTTTINGKCLQVDRIFLMLEDGTSGLNTKVEYILFYGTINKRPTVQKLIP